MADQILCPAHRRRDSPQKRALCSFATRRRTNAQPTTPSDVPAPTLQLIDWFRPLLDGVVRELTAAWPGHAPLDLSDHLVVVPTRRSGRRLREALAAHAATRGQAVFPPRVVQPEQLLADAVPVQSTATPADMLVAWIDVLRALRIHDFDAVFPVAPADQGFAWAARLARQLTGLQATLVEAGLRIADVPERAGTFAESRRWQQLAQLERQFEARLAAQGRTSLHGARIAAAANDTPPEGIRRIVLAAVPDPMPLVLRRLETLCARVPVVVFVHGPDLALFDPWGRPLPPAWEHRSLPLESFESHVHPCADPSAQAELVSKIAQGHLRGPVQPEAMLGIAVADPEILAPLHHELGHAGIRSYDPEGTPHRRGELYRLLEVLLDLVEDPAFETAGAALRCPAVLEWLARELGPDLSPAGMLEALDAIRTNHLPASIQDARAHAERHRVRRDEAPWQPAGLALARLDELVALAAGPFPVGALTALARVYGHRRLRPDHPEDGGLIAAAESWAEAARATGEAVARSQSLGTTEAWRLALQQFGDSRAFDEKPAGALELQGWLELAWEDAPHLVVAGLNEGRVPAAVVGDAFLPEPLRELLGLKTNAGRLARDAYLLHAIVSSRSRHGRTDLLFGRASAAGDPLRPSRVLLLCDDAALPARVAFLFRDIPARPGTSVAWARAWALAPAAPRPVSTVSVTGFRDHLACPFRFYLRHVLRMREVDPRKEELDALDFGNLVHHALEGLYHEPAMRRCTDPAAVRAFLVDRLDRRARALYGTDVPVPLLVQLESARQRLGHAARIHAGEAAAGWTIHAVERAFTCPVGPVTVTGRIDRIDMHDTTGLVRVLDYKTFDQTKTPQATHVRRMTAREAEAPPPGHARFTSPDGDDLVWTDLQLPLYRRALAPEFGEAIELGYFNLPKAATETSINLWAGFDRAWQEAADRCAEGVAAGIAAGVFWPPSEDLDYTDEFAALFHEGSAASVAWTANPACTP